MSFNFKLPQITGSDPTVQISSIQNYLYQLVEQLNHSLNILDSNITETSEKVIGTATTREAKEQEAQEGFDAVKGLIIKSADIVKAYYEKMKLRFSGEYLAGGDFGTYVESTVTDIEISNTGVTSIVRTNSTAQLTDKVATDKCVMSVIDQSSETIKLKADKIALEGYTTINEGFTIDDNGNMSCQNATISGDIMFPNSQSKVVGGQGLYSSLQFRSEAVYGGTLYDVGFDVNYDTNLCDKYWVYVDAFIPTGFTVTSAYLTLAHTPLLVDGIFNSATFTNLQCYAQQIAMYKQSTVDAIHIAEYGGGMIPSPSGTELTNVFGANGWTATNTTTQSIYQTSDIKNDLALTVNANNRFFITNRGTNAFPSTLSEYKAMRSKCCKVSAILTVNGYMSI